MSPRSHSRPNIKLLAVAWQRVFLASDCELHVLDPLTLESQQLLDIAVLKLLPTDDRLFIETEGGIHELDAATLSLGPEVHPTQAGDEWSTSDGHLIRSRKDGLTLFLDTGETQEVEAPFQGRVALSPTRTWALLIDHGNTLLLNLQNGQISSTGARHVQAAIWLNDNRFVLSQNERQLMFDVTVPAVDRGNNYKWPALEATEKLEELPGTLFRRPSGFFLVDRGGVSKLSPPWSWNRESTVHAMPPIPHRLRVESWLSLIGHAIRCTSPRTSTA